MAMVTPSRRTTPPRYAVAFGGSSNGVDEHAPRFSGRRHLTIDLSASPPPRRTRHRPGRQPQIRAARSPTPDASMSACTSGAITRTSAPAASNLHELRGGDRTAADEHHAAPGEIRE
jgi:hypothetical protein